MFIYGDQNEEANGVNSDTAGFFFFVDHNGTRCKVKGKLNIQNIGAKNAASSMVKFYLSDDNTFDDADTYLKQVYIKNIITGESLDKNFKYAFPYGQTLTDKYIIAAIDVDNTVFKRLRIII